MKITGLLTGLVLLLLAGCGNRGIPGIDEYAWTMTSVLTMADGQVIACGEKQSSSYENARKIELVCTAEDGTLTLTDQTNNQTYAGTYQLSEKNQEAAMYTVSVSGLKGLGIAAMTEYLDGSKDPTFILNLGGYMVYFLAE